MRNTLGVFIFVLCVLIGLGIVATRFRAAAPLEPVAETAVVELRDGDTYDMTASYVTKTIDGVEQKMLAYNGMIPGPTLKIPQGAHITINFKNKTDIPALLHSHGVRMDTAYDGAQTSQDEIPPGGSFTYKLTFPDAGVFWYHPHAGEVYEQPLGLYGAYVVMPLSAEYYPPFNSEHVLFLSDLPATDGRITLTKTSTDNVLMGHYGNVFLVNGQEHYTLDATVGEVLQLYVINAASARPYRFAIAGARMKLVGGDNGAYEKATWHDSVTLGPSERAIVQVLFAKPGTYALRNATPDGTTDLGSIVVHEGSVSQSYASQFATLQKNAEVTRSIDPFRALFAAPVDKQITLSVDFNGMMAGHMGSMGGGGMHGTGMHGSSDGIEWNATGDMMSMMNSMSTVDETKWKITDDATGKSNMDIDWNFAKNVPVKIEIYNDPRSMHPMQHPVHFHGERFLVLSVNGVSETNLVWKDTVLVPAGARVVVLLDTSNPGHWMAHCHISEHLQAGMMLHYTVE